MTIGAPGKDDLRKGKETLKTINFAEISIMRHPIWHFGKTNLLLALAVALAGAGTAGIASAASPDAASCTAEKCAHVPAPALNGAWEVLVGLVDCRSGAAMGPMFPSLLAFADGGTFVETTTNPAFAAGQREPGVGVWSRISPGVYQAKSEAFIQFTTTANPPATPGFEAGIQTITQTIVFDSDPDHWTANAKVLFSDTTGATYRGPMCAKATAQRLQ
jgi:hypothetical protein